MKLSCVFLGCLLGAVVASPTKRLLYQKPGQASNSGLGIYKGKHTTILKHPYLVCVCSILWDPLCAGSIIADKYVLTSGDCVNGAEPEEISIVAGTEFPSYGGKVYTVIDIIVHPDYGVYQFDYDYGLLKVKGKFKWSKKIKPINLPKKKVKIGSTGIVAGWGPSSEGSNSGLLQGKMDFISLDECASIYTGYDLTFTNRIVCSYNKGKVSPCSGDWADPTTENDELISMFTGIATSGECTKDAFPAIGANVHAAVPWIKNVTDLSFD